jgi:(2Fe-2S) ferredoxin
VYDARLYWPDLISMSDTSFYQHHVFFCINARDDGRACCADRGAKEAQEHAKKRMKQLNLNGQGKVRINKAGCLDRCEEGPVLVIYPQGTSIPMLTRKTSPKSSTRIWSVVRLSTDSRSERP